MQEQNEHVGLLYEPKFIRLETDYNYGDIITHEAYNAILNKNQTQGDYNTEVLRILFTDDTIEGSYHIPYIDKILDEHNTRITKNEEDIADLYNITDLLDGRVDTLEDTVQVLRTDVDTNTNNIATLTQNFNTLNTTVGQHTNQISELQTNVTNNRHDIDANSQAISNLQTATGQLRTDLNNTNTVVANHTAAISAINNTLNTEQQLISALTSRVNTNTNDISTIKNTLNTGVPLALRANTADTATTITGANTCGPRHYYGTADTNTPGWQELPKYVSAESVSVVPAGDIYITPMANSVEEGMLTPEVRTKLNRVGITDYDDLDNRPRINSITLTGNKSLSDLGIQPAGSYLTTTEAASTYYTKTQADNKFQTDTQVNTAINSALTTGNYVTASDIAADYYNKTQADARFITPAATDTKISTALTPYLTKTSAASTYLTITNAAATYTTPTQVTSSINTALANYSTTTEMNTAIANAPFLTQTQADSRYVVPSTLNGYYTKTQSDSRYPTTSAMQSYVSNRLGSYLTISSAASTYNRVRFSTGAITNPIVGDIVVTL